MTCISFADWIPRALLAVLAFGVVVGLFLNWGIDRAELAAYRRIARLPTPCPDTLTRHSDRPK